MPDKTNIHWQIVQTISYIALHYITSIYTKDDKAWKNELDGNEMKPEFVHDISDTTNTFSVTYYRFAMLNVCEDIAKIKVELVTERVRVGKGTCW